MAHRCLTTVSLNTARRSLKPIAPLCRQRREAETSDGERNLSIASDSMTNEDDRTEACGEHCITKQLGSMNKKNWEAKSGVLQQDRAAELLFIQINTD